MRSTFGSFVPPNAGTSPTRAAGCTQNFVRPTRVSPRPRAKTSSVSEGQSETTRMRRKLGCAPRRARSAGPLAAWCAGS
jgi:hypothetical protein